MKKYFIYWEIYWISEYKKLGHDLCNTTIGGEGGDTWSGRKHSDETKNKLRQIRYKQIEDGKIFPVKGESNGRSKLTAEQVIEMRKLRENGFSYGKLSIKFGVAKSTVINIIKKRKWIDI
jgi:DNA invertase Pin-like site-specific DNA recombinase